MARNLRPGAGHRGTSTGTPDVPADLVPDLVPAYRKHGILPEGELRPRREARQMGPLIASLPGGSGNQAVLYAGDLCRRGLAARGKG